MGEQLEIWGVNDPNISAQLALAVKLDLFKKKGGLNVSCRFIESGTTMPRDVLEAEKKPFAFMQTPISAILLHEQGLSTKVIAPLADIAGTQQLIIHKDSNIRTPKDLEGKRIGMAKGAAVYIALINMAKDYQVDLDKIYFINLLPSDQLDAFHTHRLDAIACWEPWTSEAVAGGGQFYISGNRSEVPGMAGDVNWLVNQSCLIAPDESIQQAPEQLTAILEVLQEATTMINYSFEKVAEPLADFFGMNLPDLAAIMRKNTYSMTMDTIFRIGVLSFRDFLFETGRLSRELTEVDLYLSEILRNVDPSLVLVEESREEVTIFEKDRVYYRPGTEFEGDTSKLRFVLADDSGVVRNFLHQTLDILGAEVLGEATNGLEAIELFKKFRPNFVTMDLAMPGLSGVDAIRSIRKISQSVNILVISGLDVQEVREEVFKLGAKMYIRKPFEPAKAAAVIRSMLD
ncbi:MAG: response regulator [bacterium]|nr:response regulator [bacterium]